MVSSFYFLASLILFLHFSTSGFGDQVVTSNDAIPGYLKNVSFIGNNLDISSFPIVNLQLKSANSGTVKFFMVRPLACKERTITLSYGSSECEFMFTDDNLLYIRVNKVPLIKIPAQVEFMLENNKISVNGHKYSGLCDSMPTNIYKLSIIGACETPITFFSTAIVLSDATTSTSTPTTSTSTSLTWTRTSTNAISTLSGITSQTTASDFLNSTSSLPVIVGKQTSSSSPVDSTVSGIVQSASFPWAYVGGIGGGVLLLSLLIGACLIGYCCLWKKRPGAKNEIPGETTFGINDGGKMQGKSAQPKSIIDESVAGTIAATTNEVSSSAAPNVVDFHLPANLVVVLPVFGPTLLPSGYKEAAEKIMHKVIAQIKFKNEVRQMDVFFGKEYADVAALDEALLEECQEMFAAFVRARFEYLAKPITKQAVFALVETFVNPAAIQKAKIDVHQVQYGYEAIDGIAEPIPLGPSGTAPSPYNALKQLQRPSEPSKSAAPTVATAKQKTMAPSKTGDGKRKYFKSGETQTLTTTRVPTQL